MNPANGSNNRWIMHFTHFSFTFASNCCNTALWQIENVSHKKLLKYSENIFFLHSLQKNVRAVVVMSSLSFLTLGTREQWVDLDRKKRYVMSAFSLMNHFFMFWVLKKSDGCGKDYIRWSSVSLCSSRSFSFHNWHRFFLY